MTDRPPPTPEEQARDVANDIDHDRTLHVHTGSTDEACAFCREAIPLIATALRLSASSALRRAAEKLPCPIHPNPVDHYEVGINVGAQKSQAWLSEEAGRIDADAEV